MIDGISILTGGLALCTVGTAGAAMFFKGEMARYKASAMHWNQRCLSLQLQLDPLRAAEAKRRQHLREAGRKGALASNAKRKGVRKAAIAKTVAAIPTLTLRPRNEVVAGVLEGRAAKKLPAESVAQK